MRHLKQPRHGRFLPVGALLAALASLPASGADTSKADGAPAGATLLGGALPGGAVLSARSVTVVPVAGGVAVSAPIAADGTFKVVGLAPGRHRLSLASATAAKQTQGATFGERVNAGLANAGSAVASGVGAKHDTAKNSIGNVRGRDAQPQVTATDSTPAASTGKLDIHSGMPNRISMNVTTARQSLVLEVDGAPVDTEVGPDGTLSGRVSAR